MYETGYFSDSVNSSLHKATDIPIEEKDILEDKCLVIVFYARPQPREERERGERDEKQPEEETVVGLLWFGYPKMTPTQSRKPVDEVMERLP